MIDEIVSKSSIFLLILCRAGALVFTLPLLNMRTISRRARLALSLYMAYLLMNFVSPSTYGTVAEDGVFSMYYFLLMVGEALIGIIMGFYVSVIFASFSTAGQFFAFQMGFSASEVYDALSQVENPLMGQFFNLVSMLVFMQNAWFQKLFIKGLAGSLTSLTSYDLILHTDKLASFMVKSLTNLFADAMLIALPIMGSLFLITVCTGLLSKAAPQMNLLSEGFPVMILLAFMIIYALFPSLCEFFIRSFTTGLEELFMLLVSMRGK